VRGDAVTGSSGARMSRMAAATRKGGAAFLSGGNGRSGGSGGSGGRPLLALVVVAASKCDIGPKNWSKHT